MALWSDACPDIAPAWKLLSAVTDRYSRSLQPPYQRDGLLAFIHCTFNTQYPHLSEAFTSVAEIACRA